MSFFFKSNNNFRKFKSEMTRRFPIFGADVKCNAVESMISVVLPVFNGEMYLKEAVDSVLAQTYPNLELIIVDDGSTDRSGEIADSYLNEDDRVKVIHQKNMKLPSALNNGFDIARGEYYTWTSADNRMFPDCLEVLATELERDRTCDMVFGNMRLIDENGDILRGKGWYELPPLSGNVILPDSVESLNNVANNTIGAAFLYRAGAAAVLQPYNRFTLEDYDYFMRMNSLFSIKHILYKKPIYEYRMHPESLTSHDEEIGITSSRPELMAFDKFRRDFYLKNTKFYIDGDNSKRILPMIDRVSSIQTANKLAGYEPKNIGYINIGNCAPTWEVPDGVPRMLITDNAISDIFGYDAVVCRNSISSDESKRRICINGSSELSAFVSLYAKEYLIRRYENMNQ